MKNSKKRGFTIVELVIVIAVIAILAGVLIPTFVSVINKANVSSDTALVRGINEALAIEGVTETPATMHQALQNASAYGYTIEKLTPRSTGDIVWNSETNHFALVDKDGNTVYSANGETVTKNAAVWKIAHSKNEISTEYSNYLAYAENGTLDVSTGIDVGNNANVAVNYSNTAEQTVTLRTNGGELTVNGSKSVVYHYGLATTVVVENVGTSYHEYGYVTDYLEAKVGHIAIESGASVSILAINGTATVNQNSGSELFKVVPVGTNTIDDAKINVQPSVVKGSAISDNDLKNTKYGGGEGTETKPYEFYTASHLVAFAKDVNAGTFRNYVSGKLCADINVAGMGWEPIGNADHPFYGSFDGQNHKISGLTNKGYTPEEKLWGITSVANNYGVAYGFFGVVGTKKDSESQNVIVLKDIQFVDVNIDIANSNMLGVVLGADVAAAKVGSEYVNKAYNGDITISGMKVSGSVKSTNGAAIGGIVGRTATGERNTAILTIENCVNNATLTAASNGTEIKLGGIIGYSKTKNINLIGCVNNGNINITEGKGYFGGIMAYTDAYKNVYMYDCKNTSTMTIANGVNVINCGLLVSRWKVCDGDMRCSVEGAKVVSSFDTNALTAENYYNDGQIAPAEKGATTVANRIAHS